MYSLYRHFFWLHSWLVITLENRQSVCVYSRHSRTQKMMNSRLLFIDVENRLVIPVSILKKAIYCGGVCNNCSTWVNQSITVYQMSVWEVNGEIIDLSHYIRHIYDFQKCIFLYLTYTFWKKRKQIFWQTHLHKFFSSSKTVNYCKEKKTNCPIFGENLHVLNYMVVKGDGVNCGLITRHGFRARGGGEKYGFEP